jgi:hypothetical protein
VNLTGWFGVLASGGPLAPGGWFIYLPYALMLAWLVSVTTVMVRRRADGQPLLSSGYAGKGRVREFQRELSLRSDETGSKEHSKGRGAWVGAPRPLTRTDRE